MYSSNSFNVCPHCGKANSLNARYCSGCGKQLAVPESVVVCHKCHRPNSSLASYCGGCGTPLRVGAQTKICPKCHKEVSATTNVCSCGYSFSTVKYASPDEAANNKVAKAVDPRHKGARAIAVFMLIFVLLFAYLIMVPAAGRPAFLKKFDKGLFDSQDGLVYGYDMVFKPVKTFLGDGFSAVKDMLGIGGWLWTAIIVIFTFTLLIQFISIIVQLANAKRHKHINWFHMAMAILTTLCVAAALLFNFLAGDKTDGWMLKALNFFTLKAHSWGFVLCLIPVYYWLCFFFSIGFKQKKVKEQVA